MSAIQKIVIQVKTRAKKSLVEPLNDGTYKVFVRSGPVDGEANDEIISLISAYFNVPKANVRIKQGAKNSRKLLEITGK